MKANIRFMKLVSAKTHPDSPFPPVKDWETLQTLEGVEDPILPPIGGTYRNGADKYRVNEVDYGYLTDRSEFEDGVVIAIITVEVS